MWAATSPESGWFRAGETCSGAAELADRLNALRDRGQGYLEVWLQGREFPMLTLGFQGSRAVMHLFEGADRVSLLVGDGTAAVDDMVDVPIMDEPAAFTGEFVLGVDRAWALVRDFIRTGAGRGAGEWREL